MLVHHPDRGGWQPIFIRIQTAAAVLRDADERAAYNRVPHHVYLQGGAGPLKKEGEKERRKKEESPVALAKLCFSSP